MLRFAMGVFVRAGNNGVLLHPWSELLINFHCQLNIKWLACHLEYTLGSVIVWNVEVEQIITQSKAGWMFELSDNKDVIACGKIAFRIGLTKEADNKLKYSSSFGISTDNLDY